MTINASVFIRQGATFRVGQTSGGPYLTIQPEGPSGPHLDLHFGQGSADEARAMTRAVVMDLRHELAMLLQSISPVIEPEPGPDDPTDEPTDEPVTLAGIARAAIGSCLYCGHAPHADVRLTGCPSCNLAGAGTACRVYRTAPESPLELAAANGDR